MTKTNIFRLQFLTAAALFILFQSPVKAEDIQGRWIWLDSGSQGELTSFEISYDTQVNYSASGFVFGGTDSDSFYMWQINTSEQGKVYLRPHVWENGNVSVLKAVDITDQMFFNQAQVTIKVSGGTAETLINGFSVDKTRLGDSVKLGRIGFREAYGTTSESAYFDNIKINSGMREIYSEDFSDSTSLSGGSISGGRLYVSGELFFVDVGGTGSQLPNTWMDIRKTFTLDSVPAEATAKIAVDSKYWMWVNGNLVVFEGSLKRGPSENGTWYDEVDLAPYLHEGENTIAVLAWYFGKDGYAHKSSGTAAFLFDADIGGTKVVSDGSWKVRKDTAYKPTTSFSDMPNYRLAESNINYVAADAVEGWESPGYDDRRWSNAVVLGSAGDSPWGSLVKREIPLFKFSEINAYENDSDLNDYRNRTLITAKTFDMEVPYNMQLTPYLKIEASEGVTIEIKTDTYLTNNGTEKNLKASYTTKEGVQEFESLGWLSGEHVYYTIPAGVKVLELGYRESGYNTEQSGSFESDDEFLNKLWTQSERTTYLNMRDTYMDCPERERAAWSGDINSDLGITAYGISSDSLQLYAKCIKTSASWQQSDGVLPTVTPVGNYGGELPQQQLSLISGLWDYYLYSGDTDTLSEVYPAYKRYLELYSLDEDGLVVHRTGDWDWGDNTGSCDMRPMDNALYYMALDSCRKTAGLLGYESDAESYQTTMDTVKENFNRVYWNGSCYKDYCVDGRANALAVVSGIADSSKYDSIKSILTGESYTSPYYEKYILEALEKIGDTEAVQSRIKTRYQSMVTGASAGSTLWEYWDKDTGTINHGWSGSPLVTMSRYMAGITPTGGGYSSFDVKPSLGSLNSIDCTVPTPNGEISVGIDKSQNDTVQTYTMHVTVPEGETAGIYIPVSYPLRSEISCGGTVIYRNGAATGELPGVNFISSDNGYIGFEVPSGEYSFVSTEDQNTNICVVAKNPDNGGSTEVETIRKGSKAGTDMPVKEGCRFKGWYTDSDCLTKYNGEMIYSDTVLTAGWIDETMPSLSVESQVQDLGWLPAAEDGAIIGTSGKNKRLEALKISVIPPEDAQDYDLSVGTALHLADIGWVDYKYEGLLGTTGESRRIEALKLVLTGAQADGYDVYYRVHVQNIGWMSWAKDGETAGSTGGALNIEALQVKIVRKGESVPEALPVNNTGNSYENRGANAENNQAFTVSFTEGSRPVLAVNGSRVSEPVLNTNRAIDGWIDADGNPYDFNSRVGCDMTLSPKWLTVDRDTVVGSAHVQNVGWTNTVSGSTIIGTTGRALQLEALKLSVSSPDGSSPVLTGSAHISDIGWRDSSGSILELGTTGQGRRLEAITLSLTGDDADRYDLYYRVHAQNFGWMGWAKNGEKAGTQGFAYRLEAVQVMLVEKGGAAPDLSPAGNTGSAFVRK